MPNGLRWNLRHCPQGHLIDTKDWIIRICITVTIYRVVMKPCKLESCGRSERCLTSRKLMYIYNDL